MQAHCELCSLQHILLRCNPCHFVAMKWQETEPLAKGGFRKRTSGDTNALAFSHHLFALQSRSFMLTTSFSYIG